MHAPERAARAVDMRYLVKDVDHFAGFAHAIHTYLGGVALAHSNRMQLLHVPFTSAHGLGFAFEDFLAGDERGLVMPQAAPTLTIDEKAWLYIDGRQTNTSTVSRAASQEAIAQRLRDAPADSVTWVHKGRFAFSDDAATKANCLNCTQTAEARYTALWLRERFWRAVRAREQQQPSSSRTSSTSSSSSSSSSSAEPPPISVAVHVRRGDVTYLDRYGKPSARWVQTVDMLEVLQGVQAALGMPLALPRVQVHLFSEAKGWGSNDTQALRAVAPSAIVHLDSSPSATIDALITMSRADILLMGTSGFSTWAAIFGCGVKIGPSHKPMMPFRHVAYHNTLVKRSGPFVSTAQANLTKEWASYWACKSDAACRKTLCAPVHLSDQRWAVSGLAKETIARPTDAQWHVPSEPPGGSPSPDAAATGEDGRSIIVSGWRAAKEACTLYEKKQRKGGSSIVPCVRSRWQRNLTSSLSLKHRLAIVAQRASSSPATATTAVAATAASAAPAASVAAPSLRPTRVEVRDGKSFLVWAE